MRQSNAGFQVTPAAPDALESTIIKYTEVEAPPFIFDAIVAVGVSRRLNRGAPRGHSNYHFRGCRNPYIGCWDTFPGRAFSRENAC